MQWRMSAVTFFLLLTQALRPEFVKVVTSQEPGRTFYFLNLPIAPFDPALTKGQMILEEIPVVNRPAAVKGN